MDKEDLDRVIEACDMVNSNPYHLVPSVFCSRTAVILFQGIKLNGNKRAIESYVASRMTFIAPNLSVITGASTAAKLMGNSGCTVSISLLWLSFLLQVSLED